MRSNRGKGFGILALFIITGAVIGGIIGEIIAGSTMLSSLSPYLIRTFPIFDMQPVMINLYVLRITLGFALYPNLVSILGIIIAILLFRRL